MRFSQCASPQNLGNLRNSIRKGKKTQLVAVFFFSSLFVIMDECGVGFVHEAVHEEEEVW